MKFCLFLLSIFFFPGKLSAQRTDSGHRLFYKTQLDTPKITGPTSTSKVISDSNSYIIELKNDSICVQHGKASLPIRNFGELDSYFDQHITQLRKSRLILRADAKLKYEQFKPLIELLKKYDLMNFELVTVQ